MSFSAGTFSINSSGQPVVSGTTISSTVFNAFTADIATGLSTCMLKDGTQVATAGIGFFAGTVSLPGIYLGTDTATGLYRIGLNNPGFSINGTKLIDLSAALVAVTGTVSATAGISTSGGAGVAIAAGNTAYGFKAGSIGARATTEPTNAISLSNGTAPVGAASNTVTLYATAGKLFAMDAAGSATQLTP